ncbi:MAG TPA: S41 family peptidase [Pyrinomonadaceae bacterium]|nr:S41 family peptidase [Pyrinomonadaceae bacterium]
MKKFSLNAAILLLSLTLALPVFVFAQQKSPPQPAPGSSSAARPSTNVPVPGRRAARGSSSNVIPMIERDFDEALELIKENYVEGKRLDYNAAFKSSIIGMLRSLDPHSNYFDREEFEELKTDQRSEYFGIGASIYSYTVGKDADTFIIATFVDAPANHAGLRFGDRILAVDGVKMTGRPSAEVRDKIRGPRGSVVKITIERAVDKRVRTLEITRDAVPQPSIPDSYLLKPGVGYVDMTRGFNYSTTEELQEAVEHLRTKGMTSLVLDLRNNPGGFLDQSINVAELFLPAGQLILTQKGRNGLRDNTYISRNTAPDLIPLVILINESTASASEIVAGAMQDHDRALIVGKTSFGKGLVQSIIPLEFGAGLTLTSAKYFTPSGRLIQRDYSNGGFYDYYTHGGSNRLDQKPEVNKPSGPEKKTDTGRAVYGGGGIAPDEVVNAKVISPGQRKLLSPIFSFSRELVNGRINGFDSYRVQQAIDFDHELQQSEFPVTDALFRSFKEFVAADPGLRNLVPLVEANRSFVDLQLRFNMVTAAYGRVMADRVFVTGEDQQVARALEVLPRARDLAMSARQRTQP